MKIKYLLIVLLSVFLLSGCIDIFQYISLQDGELRIVLRYTIQKSVFEMGASFTGEEPDYDDLIESGDSFFSEFDDFQGTVTPINTALEIGQEIDISGRYKDILNQQQEAPDFVPVKKGSSYFIKIPSMGEEEETDDTAMAFLASSKYRILVDLSGEFSYISGIRVLSGDLAIDDIEIEELVTSKFYGKTLFIEIPMIAVFSGADLSIELF